MITITLVAILGVVLVIVLMQLTKKPAGPGSVPPGGNPAPQQDLANLKVTDARPGDVISVAGAGDEMTDLDFTADRLTRFEAGVRQWFEVSGPYRERRVALRVGGDEEIEVSLHADARTITLADLGLSEDDLAQLDERQNPSDNFGFDNKNWLYRFSREARSWREDGSRPVGFYYWEFQEEGGKRILGARKAEVEPFTVTLYAAIPASDVTIYRGGK
jgi:hypothetical protein